VEFYTLFQDAFHLQEVLPRCSGSISDQPGPLKIEPVFSPGFGITQNLLPGDPSLSERLLKRPRSVFIVVPAFQSFEEFFDSGAGRKGRLFLVPLLDGNKGGRKDSRQYEKSRRYPDHRFHGFTSVLYFVPVQMTVSSFPRVV
jgi:hypothetical protein